MQKVPCVDKISDCSLHNSPHPLHPHFPFPPCCSLLSAVLTPSIMLPSSSPPLHRPPLPPLPPSVGMPGGSIRSSSLSPAVTLTPRSLRCHTHQAGACHRLHGSRGSVPEVTDSCGEGGARQTEQRDLVLTSH